MDVFEEIAKLTDRQRARVLERLNVASRQDKAKELTPEEWVFVQEYVATLDRRGAAEAAGQHPKMGNRFLTERKWKHVAEAVDEALCVREEVSELKADYVRQYLLDILELCPTDFFVLGTDGDWMVDPQQFNELPRRVKRLVQGVELRVVRGTVMLKVEFISKESALRMAAAATIGAKVEVKTAGGAIPWEKIASSAASAADTSGANEIEERIRGVRGLAPVPGPVQAEGAVLAPVQVLRETG